MKFRTIGAWGAGEGRDLTAAEVDTNFYEVDLRLDALEAVDTGGNVITNITVSGSNLYIYVETGTIYGPFELPTSQWRDAGEWTSGNSYFTNDVISVPGYGLYRVLQDHTASGSRFDASASTTDGDLYSLLIAMPNPAQYVNVTADTLLLTGTHANKYIRCNNAIGTLVYLEAGTFPDNTEIHFRQVGVGPITIVIGTSGTLMNTPQGYDAASDMVGATFTIKHVTNDEWDAFGNLAEVTA
jgi:hypothetical protein